MKKKYIIKNQSDYVYAPYGDSIFSTIMGNALEYDTEKEAVSVIKELLKKYKEETWLDYCYIVPIYINK